MDKREKNLLKNSWEKRGRKFGSNISGVLWKSLPLKFNLSLDKWMYKTIKNELPKKGSFILLDLGCGYGRLSEKILRDFPNSKIKGIDIAQAYVDLFNNSLSPRGKAVAGDIRRLPFRDNTFNVVVMATTLMYLTEEKDQLQAMSEIKRVLKKNGTFVFIERNPLGHKIMTLGGLLSKEIMSTSFTKQKMQDLAFRSGLLIKKTKGIFYWTVLFLPHLLVYKLFNVEFLKLIAVLDKNNHFNELSLYIAYIGKK